ncbi:uncharacterized protein K02A2.6-like [Belonocnema kinseyi]|uniref:uncharacterized protein K02A2.6-like n=1 Tax=Belonocnema kinseyi TaxID=2817044 RepID=UPI00143DE124|nr:uncharacterized protein K02A2.6-like [Belonocnema kinseyi]
MIRKTTPAEKQNSSYELEMLSVVVVSRKFRVYLLGIELKIITDCQALQKTMDKKDISHKIAGWAMELETFKYNIEHRSGNRIKHVDSLSRYPVMCVIIQYIVPRIKRAQDEDNEVRLILEILKEKPYQNHFVQNSLLYSRQEGRDVLVVPESMQSEIIRTAHERGHFATKRTEELTKQEYHIPNLKQKVEKIISNCVKCILGNKKQGKQEGYLHPLTKDSIPLHTYHIDHLGPLETTSKRYHHVLAVIDGFTNFTWLYPTKSMGAKEVLQKLEGQKDIFGHSSLIISDKGSAFTSDEFNSYCEEQGIKHLTIMTGLPWANGQVERLYRTIIPVLTKLSKDGLAKWYRHIERLQLVLNSTFQRSIGLTPFELLFGVQMKTEGDLMLKQLLEEEIQTEFEKNREDLRKKAKAQIMKVQEENRYSYNLRRRKATQYKEGDLVAIKRSQLGPGQKMRAKFYGPYRV